MVKQSIQWYLLNAVYGTALQESLLTNTVKVSSSCTGAYTSEMTLAVIEKTINDTSVLSSPVMFQPVSCHDSCKC